MSSHTVLVDEFYDDTTVAIIRSYLLTMSFADTASPWLIRISSSRDNLNGGPHFWGCRIRSADPFGNMPAITPSRERLAQCSRIYLNNFVHTNFTEYCERVELDCNLTFRELRALGDYNEQEGTMACSRLFRMPYLNDEIGHTLWKHLNAEREEIHELNRRDAAERIPIRHDEDYSAIHDQRLSIFRRRHTIPSRRVKFSSPEAKFVTFSSQDPPTALHHTGTTKHRTSFFRRRVNSAPAAPERGSMTAWLRNHLSRRSEPPWLRQTEELLSKRTASGAQAAQNTGQSRANSLVTRSQSLVQRLLQPRRPSDRGELPEETSTGSAEEWRSGETQVTTEDHAVIFDIPIWEANSPACSQATHPENRHGISVPLDDGDSEPIKTRGASWRRRMMRGAPSTETPQLQEVVGDKSPDHPPCLLPLERSTADSDAGTQLQIALPRTCTTCASYRPYGFPDHALGMERWSDGTVTNRHTWPVRAGSSRSSPDTSSHHVPLAIPRNSNDVKPNEHLDNLITFLSASRLAEQHTQSSYTGSGFPSAIAPRDTEVSTGSQEVKAGDAAADACFRPSSLFKAFRERFMANRSARRVPSASAP
jgi:hypothetical protein